jgi:hypothetical protein
MEMKFLNRDMGPTYAIEFDAPNNRFVLADDRIGGFTVTGNDIDDKRTSNVTETWGIFQVQVINAVSPTQATPLWQQNTIGSPNYLAGVFDGLSDTRVQWSGLTGSAGVDVNNPETGDAASGTVRIDAEGLTLKLYELDDNPGASDQANNGDVSPGFWDGVTNDPANSTFILEAFSEPGIASYIDGEVEYAVQLEYDFVYNGSEWVLVVNPIEQPGDFRALLSVANTAFNPPEEGYRFDTNIGRNGTDMSLAGNLTPHLSGDGWAFNSNDPILSNVTAPIPEPLTMGAFGLAFAGLGGYIKKRNRKA